VTALARHVHTGWIGLIGGAGAWFTAHELSFYLSSANCSRPWIAPLIHLVALVVAAASAGLAFHAGRNRSQPGLSQFVWMVGTAAGALFTVVVLWQGVATIVYSGCAR
jgi:hypothetical protein